FKMWDRLRDDISKLMISKEEKVENLLAAVVSTDSGKENDKVQKWFNWNKKWFNKNYSKKNESITDKIINEKSVKNVLIVGRTGSGKSALSNVLSGTNDFKESGYSVSETKNFRKKVFQWN